MDRVRLALDLGIAAAIVFAGIAYIATRPPSVTPALGTEPVLTGLDWPVALAFAPDGRIFFAERFTGSIRIVRDGMVREAPFFTLPNTATAGEQGLLGLALHPRFPEEPWVYAYQTYEDPEAGVFNRVVRIFAEGEIGGSLETVLAPIPAANFHNAGVISFGPDGALYVLTGDATVPGSAQNLAQLSGKVLRLNPDGSAPGDNPFVGVTGANPYVFTYGHRNMFGIAFHPDTGRPYVTENGPQDSDEVNLLVPGGNYGWPEVRGKVQTSPFVDPLIVYTPVIAPTNAAFYEGDLYPGYKERLVFGGWLDRQLHALELQPPFGTAVLSDAILVRAAQGILDVEMGPDGAIWFTTRSGIFRVIPETAAAVSSLATQSATPFMPAAVAYGAARPDLPRNLR